MRTLTPSIPLIPCLQAFVAGAALGMNGAECLKADCTMPTALVNVQVVEMPGGGMRAQADAAATVSGVGLPCLAYLNWGVPDMVPTTPPYGRSCRALW